MNHSQSAAQVLRLALADGVGAKTYAALVEHFGSPEAVSTCSAGVLQSVRGVGPKTAAAIADVSESDVEEELAISTEAGAAVICFGDERYPAALKTIPNPPPVIWVRGEMSPEDVSSIGVVGSRRCSHYGMEQAERFGGLLARAGLTVISGGARGIDTAAHRGALRTGGRTVAVMGCGLGHVYPPENADLFEEIVAEGRGALVSELPMRTAVLSGNFPMRNRIISGMSLGTLVVEAALPSGALITAREAAEQGRDVFAVPGRVDSPTSAGTLQLLRDGACLVADLDDILNGLGDVGEAFQPDGEPAPEIAPTPQDLPPRQAVLYSLLAEGGLRLDELVARSEISPGDVASEMTMLVLRGLVAQSPGNRFDRKR
ncbi:MAG: DNA-protecting protein DprA [Phycisphaerales bacterium]|nr:DNA-protecting protein DprA [Phycisphaerales bacterium]MBT7171973.1 DNA-protecting protein DprA [Phycisphaerales bacterium]